MMLPKNQACDQWALNLSHEILIIQDVRPTHSTTYLLTSNAFPHRKVDHKTMYY